MSAQGRQISSREFAHIDGHSRSLGEPVYAGRAETREAPGYEQGNLTMTISLVSCHPLCFYTGKAGTAQVSLLQSEKRFLQCFEVTTRGGGVDSIEISSNQREIKGCQLPGPIPDMLTNQSEDLSWTKIRFGYARVRTSLVDRVSQATTIILKPVFTSLLGKQFEQS